MPCGAAVAGVAGVAGEAKGEGATGAAPGLDLKLSIVLVLPVEWRTVSATAVTIKIAAKTAVKRVKKLAPPLEPKTLCEEPANDALNSAPRPD